MTPEQFKTLLQLLILILLYFKTTKHINRCYYKFPGVDSFLSHDEHKQSHNTLGDFLRTMHCFVFC